MYLNRWYVESLKIANDESWKLMGCESIVAGTADFSAEHKWPRPIASGWSTTQVSDDRTSFKQSMISVKFHTTHQRLLTVIFQTPLQKMFEWICPPVDQPYSPFSSASCSCPFMVSANPGLHRTSTATMASNLPWVSVYGWALGSPE